eukprot:m.163443 g.163443  ORF g.163443 m.163443 type:complete len:262 (-) comp15219_c0_seq1:2772-3557(-)
MARETMHFGMIALNVVYSILILAAGLLGCIGTWTYQWIEATKEQMTEESAIEIPVNVPGLNKVSCGVLTYCIDAAGEVAECSLPWPRYGGNDDSAPHPSEAPVMLWNVVAGFMMFGVILLALAFLYSLVVCFGCFSTYRQRTSAGAVSVAGMCFVIALLIFGASFNELAVTECANGAAKDDKGFCASYVPVLPSERIQGSSSDIGCRICSPTSDRFQIGACSLGWGLYVVIGAFVMTILASCIGYCVKGRKNKVRPVDMVG